MERIDIYGVFAEACKARGKWGIIMSVEGDYPQLGYPVILPGIRKTGDINDHLPMAMGIEPKSSHAAMMAFFDLVCGQQTMLLFDTQDECLRVYRRIKGPDEVDDNEYDGPVRICASTVGPDGLGYDQNH